MNKEHFKRFVLKLNKKELDYFKTMFSGDLQRYTVGDWPSAEEIREYIRLAEKVKRE